MTVAPTTPTRERPTRDTGGRTGDAWRFRYLGDRNRQSAPRSFRLEVDSAAQFGDPYSPTHQVQVARRDSRIEVTLGDAANTGDFELLLPLARGLVGLSLLPRHPVGEDGYFMLLLAPGAASEAAALRRDVVAVIDVSGSMSGDKIAQAKSALTQLLGSLREEISASRRAKLGGLLIRPAARGLRDRLDPDTYGGAYLLGLRGLAVIAHGSSGRRAIANAIRLAARGVEHDVVGSLQERLEQGVLESARSDPEPAR